MLGVVLLYIGAVLIINGLSLLGLVSKKEAIIMNICTGAVCVAAYNAFGLETDVSIGNAALGLLFGFTYLWIAYNCITDADGRGLGWYLPFVAMVATLVFTLEWQAAATFELQWLALNCAAWSLLWLSLFVLNVLGKKQSLANPFGVLAILRGIATTARSRLPAAGGEDKTGLRMHWAIR